MIIRAFITHKKAEKFADCQDRFGVNVDTKSLAVSDGMGSSWQQKFWAQILVDAFTKSRDWLPTHETIKPLCSEWRDMVENSINHLKETNAPKNIIFRNERNLAEGRSAGATFVGIRFSSNEWSGSVLGDSCLIEWDGKEAIFHTSQDGEEFDSYPDYFDSNETRTGKGEPLSINGTLSKETYLILVSDPFSDFLLEKKKEDNIALYMKQILSINTHDEFERLVDDWRTEGMHNDDSTLVIVENDKKGDFDVFHEDDIEELKELDEHPKVEPQQKPISEASKEETIANTGNQSLMNEDEKDFVKELREWLENSLKRVKISNSRIKEFLKMFFDKSICKIIERYKITKR
ncbi:MAG: protein phosphatase 2C domain-containing protein [Muribaculaceae bacterium]|nr:protein phosphatase 2C domain-containing protein [Muribaculaceae bacterium]